MNTGSFLPHKKLDPSTGKLVDSVQTSIRNQGIRQGYTWKSRVEPIFIGSRDPNTPMFRRVRGPRPKLWLGTRTHKKKVRTTDLDESSIFTPSQVFKRIQGDYLQTNPYPGYLSTDPDSDTLHDRHVLLTESFDNVHEK